MALQVALATSPAPSSSSDRTRRPTISRCGRPACIPTGSAGGRALSLLADEGYPDDGHETERQYDPIEPERSAAAQRTTNISMHRFTPEVPIERMGNERRPAPVETGEASR
jgi:hypothetical protein